VSLLAWKYHLACRSRLHDCYKIATQATNSSRIGVAGKFCARAAAAVMVYGRDNVSCVCFLNSSAINSEFALPPWLGQDSGSDSVWWGW
jgi:hypothetical protein